MSPLITESSSDLISLTDAAEQLAVHYMTAYRYVRTGRMAAHKRGGQWWVERSVVEAVAAEGTGVRRPSGQGEPRALLVAPFTDRLLAGDGAGCWDLISNALQTGATPGEVHRRMLQPAMERIGELWCDGEITIAAEHRATSTATRLIGQMSPLFRHPGRRRGQALVGTVANDPHSLPSAILADLLSDLHFEVMDLGANTPAQSFIEVAHELDGLVAIGICVGLDSCVDGAVQELLEIRASVPAVPLIVGGASVGRHRSVFEPHADYLTGSADEACDAFEAARVAASLPVVERA